MGLFTQLEAAPADPLFGLMRAYNEDPRPDKVSLGVGVFRDGDLKVPLLRTVHQAEALLLEQAAPKGYLGIAGDPVFVEETKQLLFGTSNDAIAGAQAPGGTGGLRVGGDFLHQVLGLQKIVLSDPSWANHKPVFGAGGLDVGSYPYYDKKTHALAHDEMLEALKTLPAGTAVLFHACCHNPTGVDPTLDQWKAIAQVVKQQGLVPFFDIAYQGFGEGFDQDAAAIRHFLAEGIEMVVSYSYSKNMGLYAERVGAIFVVTGSAAEADRALSHLRKVIRPNYSNPPLHGAAIARTILQSPELRAEWHKEVDGMRLRVQEMRKGLMAGLMAKGGRRDFGFLGPQKGMFSFTGLERDQVERLKNDFGIYMPGSGRINVTGLNSSNLDYVVEAIVSVINH